jgi:hypothetical protein
MKSPKPPAAPDPVKTAAAQTASNEQTARTQFKLNAFDEYSPMGSVTWQQDASAPDKFTRTTTLSPDQQKLYDTEVATGQKLGSLAGQQTDKIGNILNKPLVLDNEATEGRLFDLGRKRLDPVFREGEEALRTRLANQGFSVGSEGYDREMRNFGESRNDAYNQLALTGRNQAMAELLQERAAPINEITALMSGSQVSLPGATSNPSAAVAPTDVLGAYGLQQSALQRNADRKQSSSNALMSGLFSRGSAGLGGWAYGGFK